jgi:NADPH:quinone reductase-like Zn-dependent oxidoreductase
MKALRFYAPEDVRLEEVDEPTCGPGEIKLRVRNCSTCGTDVKIFYNGHQNLTPPRTIGHEIAGEVVEVGADVNATYGSQWQVGDRAQVIAAVPCGECYECKKGWMAVCQNQTSVGYQYDGGFAAIQRFIIIPLFLFGGARVDLSAARAALQDMQENRCFYCGSAMKQDPHVDHFIPWSRYPRDLAQNKTWVPAQKLRGDDGGGAHRRTSRTG